MNGRCCVDCSQRYYRILTQRVQKYFIFSNFNLKVWIVRILFSECAIYRAATVMMRVVNHVMCLSAGLKC